MDLLWSLRVRPGTHLHFRKTLWSCVQNIYHSKLNLLSKRKISKTAWINVWGFVAAVLRSHRQRCKWMSNAGSWVGGWKVLILVTYQKLPLLWKIGDEFPKYQGKVFNTVNWKVNEWVYGLFISIVLVGSKVRRVMSKNWNITPYYEMKLFSWKRNKCIMLIHLIRGNSRCIVKGWGSTCC